MFCCRIRNNRYPRIIMFFKGSNVMKWTWSLQPKWACKTSGFPVKPEFLIFQALFQSLIGCSIYCKIMFTFISLSAVQLNMIHFFIFQKMCYWLSVFPFLRTQLLPMQLHQPKINSFGTWSIKRTTPSKLVDLLFWGIRKSVSNIDMQPQQLEKVLTRNCWFKPYHFFFTRYIGRW